MKLLLSLLLSISLLLSPVSSAFETAKISQEKFIALQKSVSPAIVLDVRSADEFAQGHIDGAINISHTDLESNISKLEQFKDKTVVVYCRSGRRAGIAEALLKEKGFEKLLHLDGDMNGWKSAGLPITK